MSLEQLASHIWSSIGLGLAVGVFVMGAVQIIKDFAPLRAAMQKRWLHEFLSRALPENAARQAAISELVELSSAGNEEALYSLPIEKLTGQLNAAAEVVVDSLAEKSRSDSTEQFRFHNLLELMTAGDEKLQADIKWLETYDVPTDPSNLDDGQRQEYDTFIQARRRVVNRIERNLDAILVTVGTRWRQLLQTIAMSLSFLIAALIFIVLVRGDAGTWSALTAAIITALLGGYASSALHNLLAAFQQRRP